MLDWQSCTPPIRLKTGEKRLYCKQSYRQPKCIRQHWVFPLEVCQSGNYCSVITIQTFHLNWNRNTHIWGISTQKYPPISEDGLLPNKILCPWPYWAQDIYIGTAPGDTAKRVKQNISNDHLTSRYILIFILCIPIT